MLVNDAINLISLVYTDVDILFLWRYLSKSAIFFLHWGRTFWFGQFSLNLASNRLYANKQCSQWMQNVSQRRHLKSFALYTDNSGTIIRIVNKLSTKYMYHGCSKNRLFMFIFKRGKHLPWQTDCFVSLYLVLVLNKYSMHVLCKAFVENCKILEIW